MVNFDINTIANCVGKAFIEERKNSIVYQWLKRPCLSLCHDQQLLNPDSMFYLSYWVLDLIKQYKHYDDYRLVNEIQCIPHYIGDLLGTTDYDGTYDNLCQDCMFVLLALSTLVGLIDDENAPKLAQHIKNGLEELIPPDLLNDDKYFHEKHLAMIWKLTKDSAIYTHSMKIASSPEYEEKEEEHLINSVNCYMVSPRRISEEIEAYCAYETGSIHPGVNNLRTKSPKTEDCHTAQGTNTAHNAQDEATIKQLNNRIEELKKELQEKDKMIETQVREAEERALQQSPIRIAKGYKQRAMVLLSAMFYAGYFESTDDSITNRDHFVQAIMQYGFGDTKCNSIRQSLDNYEEKNGDLNELKKDLRKSVDDALGTLACYQNEEKKTTKTNRRI